ncbi:MAG: flavodoxin domain-containing protein [Bacilli bacterium]|jgi:hypothetical protein|nr:flavodoxin domain-containing protein [Bacilli bacterium]MDD4056860.1 flavodoxin domain-containing protein [Bacilli bacterium]MDY0208568.1 flavodoxin domain-containing protein [Bacilli bacterium]
MITAIVYKSNTGFTEKYAMMLAETTGLQIVSLVEAKNVIKPKAEIIYLGWIFAGMVSGLNKVRNKYQVKAIGAVGLSENNKENYEVLKKQNKINDEALFYLHGGIDKEKQKGVYKWLFNLVIKISIKEMNKKPESEITDDEIKKIYYMQHGCDFVSEENLNEFTNWYGENKE